MGGVTLSTLASSRTTAPPPRGIAARAARAAAVGRKPRDLRQRERPSSTGELRPRGRRARAEPIDHALRPVAAARRRGPAEVRVRRVDAAVAQRREAAAGGALDHGSEGYSATPTPAMAGTGTSLRGSVRAGGGDRDRSPCPRCWSLRGDDVVRETLVEVVRDAGYHVIHRARRVRYGCDLARVRRRCRSARPLDGAGEARARSAAAGRDAASHLFLSDADVPFELAEAAFAVLGKPVGAKAVLQTIAAAVGR